MPVKTYTEQLEQVQAAIDAIELRGQRYTIDGRSFDKGDLKVLYEREERLRRAVVRESAGGLAPKYGTPQ